MEMRKYNQMYYRQILDGQVKSKEKYPVPIPLEPHLENRFVNNQENIQEITSNLIFKLTYFKKETDST